MPDRYRVWCLSWDDTEDEGRDYRTSPDMPLTASIPTGAGNAAEMYAEYVHDKRDGWDSSWPLIFRVRLPDDSIEDFEVHRESVPQFNASSLRKRELANAR